MRTAVLGAIGLLGVVFASSLAVSPAGAGPAAGFTKLDAALRLEQQTARVDDGRTTSFFAQTSDPARLRREIERLGGTVNTVAGDILTVRMPVSSLAALVQRPELLRAEGARRVHAKLDKSIVASKVDKVHAGAPPLTTAYKGAGVIVGVVDIGLDLGHDAFKSAGKTRVVGLWDQTLTGAAPPAGFSYGVGCSAAELAAGSCAHSSTGDHGTHVTGIAAGSKVDEFTGMAPESEIAFVNLGEAPGKTGDEALTTAICDAVSFIFKTAEAAGKPSVVNMSLGEHSGPHDGQSLADKCLDNLAGPGKIMVAAAGNEGAGTRSPFKDDALVVHASGTASATPVAAKFRPGATGEGAAAKAEASVYVWAEADSNLSVRVGWESPITGNVFSTPITSTVPLASTTLTDGTNVVGPVSGAGAAIAAGPKSIVVNVGDVNSDRLEGDVVWLLEVTGSGKWDAYIDTTPGSGFLAAGQPAGVVADSAQTIGFPGSASQVITVASYVTRNEWTQGGTTYQQKDGSGQQVTLGALSKFSSHGPPRVTKVVTLKPDIAAPGELVASALNSKAPVKDATRVLKPSPNGIVLLEGTSMATPAVTGIIALMLERNKSLTVGQIRAIFDTTSVKPEGVTTPNSDWGRGKIDALAAVNAVTTATPPGGTDGGTSGGPSDAGSDAGPPPAGSSDSSSGGCGCTTAGAGYSAYALYGLAIAGLTLFVRRRRDRTP